MSECGERTEIDRNHSIDEKPSDSDEYQTCLEMEESGSCDGTSIEEIAHEEEDNLKMNDGNDTESSDPPLDQIQLEFLRRLKLSIEQKNLREESSFEKPSQFSPTSFSSYPEEYDTQHHSFPNFTTAPFLCQVELIRTEENKGMLEHVEPIQSWSAALSDARLRETVKRMYPEMLPLQQVALPSIKNPAFDCVFQCPSGQGRTTTWMLPTLDFLLGKGDRTHSNQVHCIVCCASEEKADELREDMYVYIPRNEQGIPLFRVDLMNYENYREIDMKVCNVGSKVIITTPVLLTKAPFLSTASIRMLIIDRYEDVVRYQEDVRDDDDDEEVDGLFDEIFNAMDKEKRESVKTTITTSQEVRKFPFREEVFPVITGKAMLSATEHPRMQFLYIESDEDAYQRLKQTIKREQFGTCVVFVNGYTERLWEELPQELSRLRFGFLTHKTDPIRRVEFLRDYKMGKFDVVVATYQAEKYLECFHRVLDIYYVIPQDDLHEFKRLLNRRVRICRGDSITFLESSDYRMLNDLKECAERACYDSRHFDSLRARMMSDLKENERLRQLRKEREERQFYSQRDYEGYKGVGDYD